MKGGSGLSNCFRKLVTTTIRAAQYGKNINIVIFLVNIARTMLFVIDKFVLTCLLCFPLLFILLERLRKSATKIYIELRHQLQSTYECNLNIITSIRHVYNFHVQRKVHTLILQSQI